MEQDPLAQLPPEVYRSLHCWYTISAITICGTLLLLAGLQVWFYYQIHHLERQAQPYKLQKTLQQAAHAHDLILQSYAQHRKACTKILQTMLSAVPETVTLHTFSLEYPKTISLSGYTSTTADIGSLIKAGKSVEFPVVSKLTTQTAPDYQITFSLRLEPLAAQEIPVS